jgi:hypothetical protein
VKRTLILSKCTVQQQKSLNLVLSLFSLQQCAKHVRVWSGYCAGHKLVSRSGTRVLHADRQPTRSWPVLQTLLHGRTNAALTVTMTFSPSTSFNDRDGDRWLLLSLSMTFTWPPPHLFYEHHICTIHIAQSVDVMGSVFCAHRSQITVCTSSLVHFLSTVTIFQVTLRRQHISCTSDNTCHLVQGACINAWQNSSLPQPFVLQEYNWETYSVACPLTLIWKVHTQVDIIKSERMYLEGYITKLDTLTHIFTVSPCILIHYI